MLDADPAYYDASSRQRILRSAIDFESQVYENDILLIDFKRRNIILVDDAYANIDRKVVVIDFGGALFGRTRDDAAHFRNRLFLGTYISPLLRWESFPMEFERWVSWNWQDWVEETYGDTRESITPEMRNVFSKSL
ncbi:hypothetical protein ABOM_000110 [Aspergillus bombycis]|uniref:Protein kinase domain-containing protein n=1 Tax=Aspergillus bombycis TaxID=109264 RepID=A0A1F8AHF6_9EURO|nr:hypothetical protein ABOM_000110 [Aspergillus bombycis]OGM51151.1 hypothetical protein ABOM_000110 [Aspergillus bombycis]